MARASDCRHVVPGFVQLRLSPYRDVYHSVRDANGRDLLLCLQHRCGMEEDCREDSHECDYGRMVQNQRPSSDLRGKQVCSAARTGHYCLSRESCGVKSPIKTIALNPEWPLSIVLGAGSIRGLAHVAILRVLLDAGFAIKEIVGTSVGA